jgi:hypothetical protein
MSIPLLTAHPIFPSLQLQIAEPPFSDEEMNIASNSAWQENLSAECLNFS